MRITIVGSGFVGQTAAMRLVERGLGDIVLIDIVEGLPQGLALDMKESSPVVGFEPSVIGTNDYADTAGSDVVVITAGFPRQPGMSRMDLLGKNAAIMRDVIGNVVPGSPSAVLIVVSNPLDEMTFLAAEASGFPRERVMGMAGVLDSARLRYFIAEELGVSPLEVDAMTLGSHGEAMVPLPRQATVGGKPLTELVDEETLERLYSRTRDAGAEIVALLKKG
ncbi:MAG TPA: malate dehydrogenase, partial [Actinomycetota bacterium]|nr:malate dehydrogenase [Actinomycetota bacterium]